MLYFNYFKWRTLLCAAMLLSLVSYMYCWCKSSRTLSEILQQNGFEVSDDSPTLSFAGFRFQSPILEYTVRGSENARFSEEVLYAISTTSSRISVIDCPTMSVTGDALTSILQHSTLEYIRLGDVHTITEASIRLERLSKLKSLSLHGRSLTDLYSPDCSYMTQLMALDLSRTSVSDDTIMRLADLKALRQLRVGGTLITDQSFRKLTKKDYEVFFPELESLSVDHTSVTDAFVGSLTLMPQLQVLDVSNTEITDTGVKKLLATCPNLRSVFLDGCDIDGLLWCETPWPRRLDYLTVQGSRVNGDTIIRMCRSHPSIRTVLYHGCDVSRADSDEIAALLTGR